MAASFRIEALSRAHDRSKFCCGSEPLDRYLQTQATQDMKRRVATCFLALDKADESLAGYYTLTATSIALNDLAPEVIKKLPRYPVVPAVLMGRLAVTKSHQRQGLGSILLADALMRISRAEFGVFALVVDDKDEVAQHFYEHYGLALLPTEGRRLCLPIGTALQRLAAPATTNLWFE